MHQRHSSRCLCLKNWNNLCCKSLLYRSVKRETLKLIETFLDKAEDQPHIGKQFVPPMMESVLGDYARNVPDARESEVLSLFATIINKYASYLLMCAIVINCNCEKIGRSGRMFTICIFLDVYHAARFYLDFFFQVQGDNVRRRASHI